MDLSIQYLYTSLLIKSNEIMYVKCFSALKTNVLDRGAWQAPWGLTESEMTEAT